MKKINELKQIESMSNITLKEIETGIKITKATLKTLAAVLESVTKSNFEYRKNEMFHYMKQGNEPYIVEIPLNGIEKMKEKLDDNGISFLAYSLDNNGIFFTKAEDAELVQQLALQTQLESHHFTSVPLETMIQAYEGEQMSGISNLDYYMVTQFKKNVEHMSSETEKFLTYAVQLDSQQGNGSYSIVFHSEFIQEARAAYTKSSIELGGPAGDIHRSRIDKEKELFDPNLPEEKKKKLKEKRKSELIAEKQSIQKLEKLLALYERKLSLDNGEQNEVWSAFTNGEISFDEFFELEMVNDQHDVEERELVRKYAQSVYQMFHQGIEVVFDIPTKEEREQEEEIL